MNTPDASAAFARLRMFSKNTVARTCAAPIPAHSKTCSDR